DHISVSTSIFNSAVIPFQNGFAGVFRCDNKRREMRVHAGFSQDGIHWQIDPDPIRFTPEEGVPDHFEYAYDPRVTFLNGKYYVTWCNGFHGPTIGIAITEDFQTFRQLENAFLPFNRNGVLFPEKFDGYYAMLNRPSDNGHTPFGDIWLSYSPDLTFWGKHRLVMKAGKTPWQSTKIGAGPVPIKTEKGWLLFYHGVLTSCNGFVYHFGAMLLDLHDPAKVLGYTPEYLLAPDQDYERNGDVPNVVFPTAALTENNKVAIYYGAADTCIGLCFGYIDEIVEYILAAHEK
ncbi:MAG TPA: glycoside hydrolase family 130 protein, partial [Candidatus Cloacimonadota bacterium]|nr:glycoside hydrolase family 130 protein [Candidatus Cloacimonadota bacterium]